MKAVVSQIGVLVLSVLAHSLFGQCHYEPITHFYGTETGTIAPSIAFMDFSPDGSIVMAGSYTSSDSLNFGNGWISPTSDGTHGLFMAKVNLDGSTLWARAFPGTGFNSVYDVKCDDEGGVYVTGINQDFSIDGIQYDGTAVQTFYMAKFNTNGGFEWMLHEEENASAGQSLSVVGNSVFVTGRYITELNLLGQSWTAPNSSNVVFVLQVDKNGGYENIYRFPGEGSDQIMEIDCNSSSCLVAGLFEQSIEFDGQVLGTTTANNEYRFFLSKINLDTDEIDWFTSSGESGWIQGIHGINRDDNAIYLSGYFEDPLSFGSESVTTLGGRDAFVLQLDTNGTPVGLESFGGSDNDGILDVSLGNTGLVVTLFYNSSDFIIADGALQIGGGEDVVQIALDSGLNESCFSRFGGGGDEDFWSSIMVGDTIFTVGSTNSESIQFNQTSFEIEGSRDLLLLRSCLPCDVQVGLETSSFEGQVKIYPNPATNLLNITVPANAWAISIEILDMLGKEVLHQPYTTQLDVSGLPAGNYMLVVYTEKGVLREKLVVE